MLNQTLMLVQVAGTNPLLVLEIACALALAAVIAAAIVLGRARLHSRRKPEALASGPEAGATADRPSPEPCVPLSQIDRDAARAWWESPQPADEFRLRGAASLEFNGHALAEIDGLAHTVTGKAQFQLATRAAVTVLSGDVTVSFAAEPGQDALVAGAGGVLKASPGSELSISPGFQVRLRTGSFKAAACPFISESVLSQALELEATYCQEIHASHNMTLFAQQCRKVFVSGDARGCVADSESLSVQGNARVLALRCARVFACDQAAVKTRGCPDVSVRDRAIHENEA